MILTLSARCLRSMLSPAGKGKKPSLDMLDLPKFTRESLGLAGINLSTDLLAGADRSRLESIRERADRASCACLLLIEPDAQNFGSHDEALVAAAIHRTTRVVEAAHILGCSSIAVRVKASDDDAALLRVAAGLKKVVERAEKLDINLLIAPEQGLTARPERVTELLKKIGGFRVGTFPDFQAAAAFGDSVGYLHRLTPYATSVCASTVRLLGEAEVAKAAKESAAATSAAASGSVSKELRDSLAADIAAIAKAGSSAKAEGKADSKADSKSGKGKKGKADSKSDPKAIADAEAEAALEAASKAGGKKGKGKKDAPLPAVPVPVPAADEELDELDDAELDEIEALIDDVIDEVDAPVRLVAYEHEPYDLRPMINAITAVGYDGSLCLDYRGTGDIVVGLTQTRDTLVALIAEARKVGG